ncbi:MAG: hypothetical protein A2750_01590 [Candidatus Yanofskybacteria bacterium RIFCSPHIGHO2_01_FULL_45_42]|uniref:Dipeptidylpeptidase IV N-terminal domain-containing protein n=2 Tax=Candidatus Yanofskyibacteriota TaxID=1752733 RepID=A0A1F8F3T7_9BACT|nr:MAG: hypothetical protein A2750_01590 [Candidatus Yanofskybacteria bacterium RIFCSPHIGHO2_01_FULL_45_42]OGN26639.1 MAG: hypothetical protein A3B17_00545 [Candidatus Yanofskybacteria bacterium RIFCSPLOWO2_01_FULL_45_72]OGN31982.1 MAG: hypothetical protein A3J01_02810 [Candidatus Yanofskybacteria bacterium RIFCSPLOWO2_02_FULL_45_18]
MRKHNIVIFFIFIFAGVAAFLTSYLFMGIDAPNDANLQQGTITKQFGSSNAQTSNSDYEADDNPALNKPVALSARKAVAAASGQSSGSVFYFEAGKGNLFEADTRTGKETPVLTLAPASFYTAVWAPSKDGFIYSSNNFQPKLTYYDRAARQSFPLNSSARSAVFSPDSSQIAYFAETEDGNGVYLAQPDGSVSKKIFSTRFDSVNLSWPASGFLTLKVRVESADLYDLLSLTTNGQLSKILEKRANLSVAWSPKGNKALFSESPNPNRYNLFYYNAANSFNYRLPLNTSSSNCAWSADEIHLACSVPATQLSNSAEDIYVLNTLTKAKKLIYLSGNPVIRISEIFLSADESYLLFINKNDSLLYKLPLPDLGSI